MGRLTDVLLCVLAVALVALGAREVGPLLDPLGGEESVISVADVQRVVGQAPAPETRQRVTILLLGADRRPGDRGRSDTLIVLLVNPQSGRLALLGLPRDLYAAVPGHGRTKINHAYAFGGPELSRETVEGFLGLEIDHYTVCYFEGFVEAIDALGAVEVDVPDVEGKGRGMNYDDHAGHLHIHLEPGIQRLDGEQALGFVRYRKSNTPGLGDGDTQRSGRQQTLLKAVAEQHLKATSLPGLLAAARIVADNIETDMSPGDIASLARALHASGTGAMMTRTVPLKDSSWRKGQAYYAHADADRLRETLDEIEAHLDGGDGVQ
ncbi:MAG TPA: LCP family protein [Armatimonadota bacterium]|nr:LCP family protein [Armatimonadota bacterium]